MNDTHSHFKFFNHLKYFIMKTLQFLLAILCFGFFIQSCTVNNTTEYDAFCDYGTMQLDSLYKHVGIIHNNALNDFYTWVSTYEDDTITIAEFNSLIVDEFSQFTTDVDLEDLYFTDSILVNGDLAKMSFGELTDRYSYSISSELEEAADALALIIKTAGNESLDSAFDNLLNTYLSEISDCKEKITWVSMVSVAKHSCNYWKENLDEWEALGPDGSIAPRGSSWKDVALSDAIGAGVGALKGAYAGLVTGSFVVPGLGTAIGGAGGVMAGMLIGCIGGSAGAACFELVKLTIAW